ncbi:MAG: hypothetical protein RSH78_01670 [Bacilli bacterium]
MNMELTSFWINILLPVLSILIPVFVTLYTVNNRIKNQNRENHQPYVVLGSVVDIEKLNSYSYYLTPVGRNFLNENKNIDYEKIKSDNDINVKLMLNNIGYGVATNIKFYNLLTGTQVHGTQESNHEKNQKLFTTFDMQAGDEKGVQARIINLVKENNEDHIRMLCIYHDLNNNIYNFIISINAKGKGHYDFFAYQPSSKSYKKWQKENNKQFKKIIKEYN